jgi:O-antigen ligase
MGMPPFASSTRSKKLVRRPNNLMDTQRNIPIRFFANSHTLRLSTALILTIGGVALAATLCASDNYLDAAILAAASLAAGLLVASPVSVQAVMIAWFATSPLASFYIRIPADRSIITYDRAVFALIVIMLLLKPTTTPQPATERGSFHRFGAPLLSSLSISKFELAWALLAVLALASALVKSNNVAFAMRIAIDTFWLPLVAFHVARNYVDLRKVGKLLLLGGIGLSLFLFATGAFEFATGTDLFAYRGVDLVRAGERRVNGPFATDSSFAIVSLLLFLFLLAAPRLFSVRFDRTGKLAYACGVTASALGALLPLFRGVGIALVVGWIVLQSSNSDKSSPIRRWVLSRALPLLAVGILIGFVWWMATMAPSNAGDRLTSPRTAFGRLATWQAAAEISLDNPITGVGLNNYADYFDASHYYSDEAPEEILDAKAVNSPHSNLLWISAELGLPGLTLYITANVYLILMGWRAFKRTPGKRGRVAACCFLALVAAYWIPGLTLSSGYYSDLNLYFLFLLGALSGSSASARAAGHNPRLISEI